MDKVGSGCFGAVHVLNDVIALQPQQILAERKQTPTKSWVTCITAFVISAIRGAAGIPIQGYLCRAVMIRGIEQSRLYPLLRFDAT